MAKRDSFLLRIKPEVLEALRAWADDEFRSLNGQIEFALHRALEQAGRLPKSQHVDPVQAHDNLSENRRPSDGKPSDGKPSDGKPSENKPDPTKPSIDVLLTETD